MRGKCADGHAADADGIDLPYRRDERTRTKDKTIPFPLDGELFRREVPSKKRPDAELMPARVQGRVRKHGDARELDLVERRDRRVVPPSAPHVGDAAFVLEVVELVLEVVLREDGVGRAHKRAGP